MNSYGQAFYRISGDFSIREIISYEEQDSFNTHLTRGTLDYDKHRKEVVYDVTFPQREHWVLQDSVFYRIENDTIKMRYSIPYAMQVLDFDFLLSGYNYDYMFQEMECTIEDVKKEEDKVFKLWKFPEAYPIDVFQYVLTQTENGQTTALAFMDEDKNVVSRQFYKEYQYINGLNVPHVMEQRVYTDKSTYVKKLILRDVSINNAERDYVFRNDLDFLPIDLGADEGNLRERFEFSEE